MNEVELDIGQGKLISVIDLFTLDLIKQEQHLIKADAPPPDPFTEFISQLMLSWNTEVDKAIVDVISTANKLLRTEALTPEIIDAMTENFNQWLGPTLASNPEIQRVTRNLITKSWQEGKAKAHHKPIEELFEWKLIDQKAVNYLQRDINYWIGAQYGKHIGPKIAEMTRIIGIESGLGRVEVGKALKDAFENTLKIPVGFKGSPLNYYTLVGAVAMNRARSLGNVAGFRERGITHYKWEAALDERMCPICSSLDGREWKVESSYEHIEKSFDITNPEDYKQHMPWIGFDSGRASKHGWTPSKMVYPQGVPIQPQHGSKGGRNYGLFIKDPATGKKTYLADSKGRLHTKTLADLGIIAPPVHGMCRCDIIESVDITRYDIPGRGFPKTIMPTNFKTHKDAKKYLQKMLPDTTINIEELDLDFVNNMIGRLSFYKKMFPNEIIQLKKINALHFPGERSGSMAGTLGGNVHINTIIMGVGKKEYYNNLMIERFKREWFVTGQSGAVIDHELGHFLDEVFTDRKDKNWEKFKRYLQRNPPTKDLSEYGMGMYDKRERVAECFSALFNQDKTTIVEKNLLSFERSETTRIRIPSKTKQVKKLKETLNKMGYDTPPDGFNSKEY